MALQINQYAVTETGPIAAASLFDIDAEVSLGVYESRKLPFSTLQSDILNGISGTNGINVASGVVKLGSSPLTENTVIEGQTNDQIFQFKGGDLTAAAGKAASTLSFNNGAGSVTLFQRLSTDPTNDFIEHTTDIVNGIARFRYNSIVSDDNNTIRYGSTGIVLTTDDEAGGNVMSYTQFNGSGTFVGNLLYQDGSEGTAGHVLTSTGINGEMGWAAATGGIYSSSNFIGNERTVTLSDGAVTDRNLIFASITQPNLLKLDSSNDRIGIGTSTPLAILHIDTGGTGGMLMKDGSKNQVTFSGHSTFGSILNMYNAAGSSVNIQLSGQTATSFINTGQSFGIGTNSPVDALHIDGLGGGGGGILIKRGATNQVTLRSHATLGGHMTLYNAAGSSDTIQLYADLQDSFINTGFDFGIGTSTPSSKLHVKGDFRLDETTVLSKTISTDFLPINVNGTVRYIALYD